MAKRGTEWEGSPRTEPAKVPEAEGHVAEKHGFSDTAGDLYVLFSSFDTHIQINIQ